MTRKTQTMKTQVQVETVVEPTVEEETVEEETVVENEPTEETTEETTKKEKSRLITRDMLNDEFSELLQLIETEITKMREGNEKGVKGVRFLRTVSKRLRVLNTHSNRVAKTKRKANPNKSSTSGFLKQVKISSELQTFTGWKTNDLHSRVDVTKFICNYIREHNLQNPSNRREILPDQALSKLLRYDTKTELNPLTYPKIQTHIKPHFI
jgi:chromatin remodeling complex protein RSC6